MIERIDAGENDGVDDVIGQLRSCLLSDNVDPAPQSVATVVHFTMPTSGTTSVSDKVTPPDRTLAENEVEDIII